MPLARSGQGPFELTVVLGQAAVPIERLVRMKRGAVIALDADGETVEIQANGLPVARGRVLVQRGSIRVEVTELIPRPRLSTDAGLSLGSVLAR
jgi:flagellar motor switch protein FliN/FliY